MQKKILGIMMSVMMAAATMTAGCGLFAAEVSMCDSGWLRMNSKFCRLRIDFCAAGAYFSVLCPADVVLY